MEARRTVVVSGIPAALPAGRMADKLTIHFQSCRRSAGGDVEEVKFPTELHGVAFVTFDKAEDAEQVILKPQQILADSEIPEEVALTVFPFTPDVFFYVTAATLDLAAFGSDGSAMIQRLRSAHRSVRFRPLTQGSKAAVEGPFRAIRALTDDLISRAQAQSAALQLSETLNPRPISHQEFSGSLSCFSSETNRDAAAASGLSRSPQSTGEASGVQARLATAGRQSSPVRRRIQEESLDLCRENSPKQSSVFATDGMRRSLSGTECSSEPGGTRQVLGEEGMEAGIRSSSSRPEWLPSKQSGPGRASVSRSGEETRLAEMEEKLLHASPLSDGEDTEERSEFRPRELEDDCIWVDSNIFRYIKRFDAEEFERCLRDQEVSIRHGEDTDLTQITPIGRQTGSQQALETLKVLVEYRQSTLRVHWMDFDVAEEREEQRLIHICHQESAWYRDVLYVVERSGVKAVGPSTSSHLFCKMVKEKMTQMKDTHVTHV
ncbi:uncharacterized protein LOC143002329 [Genypterus blacodes]|uniref:uncharacterized protein LOC143002329 n=1 Tax=Genypterus blacodes TaxID=154954 RepID=UPI003F765FEA